MSIHFPSIDDIASGVIRFMKTEATSVLGPIETQLQSFSKQVHEALAFGSVFVVEVELLQADFDADEFRGELDTFFADAVRVAEQIPRLLVDFQVPQALQKQFIDALFKNVPSLILFPVSVPLRALPGWEHIPGKVLSVVQTLPARADWRNPKLYTESAYWAVYEVLQDLKALKSGLDAVAKIAPKDFSINIDVVGEGGGTELSGHPVKLPFAAVDLILDLSEQALDNFLTLYDRFVLK